MDKNKLSVFYGYRGRVCLRMVLEAVGVRKGDYVVCAVSGKSIPLNKLTYWNVDLQEAYYSHKEVKMRLEELKKNK